MRRAFPWWLQAFLIVGAIEAIAIGASSWLAPEGSLARRLLPLAGGTASYSPPTDWASDPSYAGYPGFSMPAPDALDRAWVRPLNGRVIGAFYLAGAVGIVASYLTRRAGDARIFVAGFGFIAGSLLILTFAYWGDFTADHVPYGWLVSYAVDPVVAAVAIVSLGLGHPDAPGRHRLTPLFLGQAAVLGMTGLVLLVAPGLAADLWPWSLTDVLARVYACFLLGFALGALLAARETRVAAIRPFAIASAALPILVLIGSARHLDRFKDGARTWGWFGIFALLAVLFVAVLPSLFRDGAPAREAARPSGAAGQRADATGEAMRSRAPRLLRPYLWVLGTGLFVQGTLTVAFLAFTDEAARRTHGLLNHDARHGAIHLAWGLAIVILLRAGLEERGLARTAVVFGLFYAALAVLGVAVHAPFGLQLGAGENGFHFLVGPSALVVGCLALRFRAAPAGPALRLRPR